MRFLSICSGIEAASVAFHPLGWEAVAFAEIEPFPCQLLAHHYPEVPNLGDLALFREWDASLLEQADGLCGGTPCQAFSVAGLRGSLDDERGNLTLTFCHLYDRLDEIRHAAGRPPAFCLWENVPGVLNTPDNAFGHFLAGLAGEQQALRPPGLKWTDVGYVRGPRRTVAWRVLDAQYFGLAQRRERVFVVASADPAFDPASVLFEFEGLQRHSPPRRGPGEGTAPTLSARTKGGGGLGTDAECDGAVVPEKFHVSGFESDIAKSIAARPHASLRDDSDNYVPVIAGTLGANGKAAGSATQQDAESGLLIPLAFGGNNTSGPIVEQVCAPLTGNAWADNASEESKLVPESFSFKASHFTRGKDGAPADICPPLSADADKGDQDTLIAFSSKDHGGDATVNLSPTLRAGGHVGSHANAGNPPAIAFPERMSGTQCARAEDVSPVLQSHNPTAVAFQPGNLARGAGAAPSTEVFPTLKADHGRAYGDQSPHVACQESFAFDLRGREGGAMPEGPHSTANIRAGSGGSSRSYVAQSKPLPFDTTQITSVANRSHPKPGDPCHPMSATAHPPAVAFQERGRKNGPNLECQTDLAYSLNAPNGGGRRQELNVACQEPVAFSDRERGDDGRGYARPPQVFEGAVGAIDTMKPHCVALSQPATSHWRVRRLTPEECEILQGFPVGYTLIPGRSSKQRKGDDLNDTIDYLMSLGLPRPEAEVLAHSPDGPRYKALGNSWAVPVVRWIGRRIAAHYFLNNPTTPRHDA